MKVCSRYDVTIGGAETSYTKHLCIFTSATDQGGLQYGDAAMNGNCIASTPPVDEVKIPEPPDLEYFLMQLFRVQAPDCDSPPDKTKFSLLVMCRQNNRRIQ